MSEWRVLDLFSGIGGFSLGLERAGMQTVAFCEIEPYPRAVLKKHWPNVPCYDDVRTLTGERLRADGIIPNVICGGFPCQEISVAYAPTGIRRGIDGPRSGLFHQIIRLACELRPRCILLENVSAILALSFGRVLGILAENRFDAEWRCICANQVCAPQTRDRCFILAYPHGSGMQGSLQSLDFGENGQRGSSSAQAVFSSDPFEPGNSWPQPLIRGVDGRIPYRMDRVKSCGNSVYPKIPEIIGRAIIAHHEAMRNTT